MPTQSWLPARPGRSLASVPAQDLPTLTDKQHVPLENGVTVGSLFDADNQVRLDKHDDQAINGAGAAIAKGSGSFNNRWLDAHSSDARLWEVISEIRMALIAVQAQAEEVKAAAAEIEAHDASEESKEIQAEIDALKGEASDAKEVIDIVYGVVTAAVYAATGEAGDAINQVGVVAGMVLGHLNDKRIGKAMNKLASAQHKQRSATAVALGARLHAAKFTLAEKKQLATSSVVQPRCSALRTAQDVQQPRDRCRQGNSVPRA